MPCSLRSPRALWFVSLVGAFVCFAVWAGLFASSVAARRTTTSASPAATATGKFNGRIASASTRNSQAFDIYTVNPDGSSPIRLTDDQGHTHNPDGPSYDFDQAWSPDGSKLAFTSNREGDSFEIFTMNADGSNVQRLTNNSIDEGQPAWSPDGTRIAFTRGGSCVIIVAKPQLKSSAEDPCVPYIYLMNADGTNQIALSTTGGDLGPVWSPDGNKLAFTKVSSNVPDSNEIYVMNANGSNRVRLTNNTAIDYV
ncbi:MAG TPA: hypothetical protein VGO73_11855 [Pyrinomonadaceae bacterium]|nr:hypothetical protein [Pyrinomonadaceae bacterium]